MNGIFNQEKLTKKHRPTKASMAVMYVLGQFP